MLCITLTNNSKRQEGFVVDLPCGNQIKVRLRRVDGAQAQVAIEAPKHINIDRFKEEPHQSKNTVTCKKGRTEYETDNCRAVRIN